MLHRVVGRHKNGVVSACFEKVVHCGTFLAAPGVLQHKVVVAQVGIFLYEIGNGFTREDIHVRVVHIVGAGCETGCNRCQSD